MGKTLFYTICPYGENIRAAFSFDYTACRSRHNTQRFDTTKGAECSQYSYTIHLWSCCSKEIVSNFYHKSFFQQQTESSSTTLCILPFSLRSRATVSVFTLTTIRRIKTFFTFVQSSTVPCSIASLPFVQQHHCMLPKLPAKTNCCDSALALLQFYTINGKNSSCIVLTVLLSILSRAFHKLQYDIISDIIRKQNFLEV